MRPVKSPKARLAQWLTAEFAVWSSKLSSEINGAGPILLAFGRLINREVY